MDSDNSCKGVNLHCNVGVVKIKNTSVLKLVQNHWNRSTNTPNADPARRKFNNYIIGNKNLLESVNNMLAKKSITKLRKNGVLALEYCLSFSPNYLRDPNTGKYRKDAKIRYLNWLSATKNWLKQEYGERVISAIVHNDESTPHVHACILPLDKTKSGKNTLNARGITGGSQKLRGIHDSYASAVKHLGLKRGIRGSKAKHTTIKEFYTALNESKKIAKKLGIPSPENPPHNYNEWTKNIIKLESAISKQNELQSTEIKDTINRLKSQNQELIKEVQRLKADYKSTPNIRHF